MLDDLIHEMQIKGLMSAGHLKLIGNAKYVFDLVNIMATTVPVEPDQEFWTLRTIMMAMDGGNNSM